MNVIRATLNKKSGRSSKRGRNGPVFNTYPPLASGAQLSKNPILSSSDFSTEQLSNIIQGKILSTARRSSTSDSHSTEPVTGFLNIAAALESKPKSKEPRVEDEFLAEVLRTPDIPNTTNSSNSKIGSRTRQILQPLPPPSTASGGRKPRSSTSSGARPLSTASHSRTPRTPHTPKTTTSASDSNQHWVVAITEGRGLARGEVGLATMDISHPLLILCQISDSQSYTNTLTKVNIIHPSEILVPNTIVERQQENKLFDLLKENFPQVSITTVQRCHFNDAYGLHQIQSLCLPEYSSVELVVHQKFYALASAAALLKFTEFMKNIIFAPKSLRIEYQSPENVMAIDINTAQRLELVMCRKAGPEKRGSLLAMLDHCCTVSGKRSLRANILQPPTSLETIDSRLLSVSELTQSPAFLHSLQTAISKFQNVEQLLWLCVQMLNLQDEQRASEIQTNYVLLLKTSLDSLPILRESLQNAQTPFFRKVLKDLDDERFGLLLTNILKVMNEDARTTKGYAASQFQRCFAIKAGINGLLDLARSIYSDLVSSMHGKVQEMAEEFNLPLRSCSTGNKGFHIQLNVTRNRAFSAKDLPPIFIQVNRSKNLITCTTEELVFFNQRLKQTLMEIQIMSNSILQELLRNLRPHVGCLYRLCENIAELDLLVAFSQVSSAQGFTSPTFGSKMDLKSSRHPILDFISPSTPVANDVFASNEKNFHIITGPNMGGKSIYIKQVALLQIMAQMKEMQYILQSLKPNSLVVIDELCRSTDHEEGTAIAWVQCEDLLKTKAFTFFTTHYLYLTKLQNLYPNVTNHQMVVEEGNEGRLKYTHKLSAGVTKTALYGLRLAQLSSLPASVVLDAQNICAELTRNKLAEPVFNDEKTEMEKDDEYIQELLDLINTDRFNLTEVKKVQKKLQQRYGIEELHQNADTQEITHSQQRNDETNVGNTQTNNHVNLTAQESTDGLIGDNVELVSRTGNDPTNVRNQSPVTLGNRTVSDYQISNQSKTDTFLTEKRTPFSVPAARITQKQEKINLNKSCEVEKQINRSSLEERNLKITASVSRFMSPNSLQIQESPVRLSRPSSSGSSSKHSLFQKRKRCNSEKVASQHSATCSPHTSTMRVNVLENSTNSTNTVSLHSQNEFENLTYSSFSGPNKESTFVESNNPFASGLTHDQNSFLVYRSPYTPSTQRSSEFQQHKYPKGDDEGHPSASYELLSHVSQSTICSQKRDSIRCTPHNLNFDSTRNPTISPVQPLPFYENARNSSLLYAETSQFRQNNESSENYHRSQTSEGLRLPQMSRTNETFLSRTPRHFVSSSHSRQSVSSTPMVLDLYPDFERIPRNISNRSVDYNEDDNNFEE